MEDCNAACARDPPDSPAQPPVRDPPARRRAQRLRGRGRHPEFHAHRDSRGRRQHQPPDRDDQARRHRELLPVPRHGLPHRQRQRLRRRAERQHLRHRPRQRRLHRECCIRPAGLYRDHERRGRRQHRPRDRAGRAWQHHDLHPQPPRGLQHHGRVGLRRRAERQRLHDRTDHRRLQRLGLVHHQPLRGERERRPAAGASVRRAQRSSMAAPPRSRSAPSRTTRSPA
jgi:hypothetical protein